MRKTAPIISQSTLNRVFQLLHSHNFDWQDFLGNYVLLILIPFTNNDFIVKLWYLVYNFHKNPVCFHLLLRKQVGPLFAVPVDPFSPVEALVSKTSKSLNCSFKSSRSHPSFWDFLRSPKRSSNAWDCGRRGGDGYGRRRRRRSWWRKQRGKGL